MALVSAFALALALASATTRSFGPPEPPQKVLERAEALWQAGDDEAVAALFARAYEADPRPEYLYGQARAESALGRCDRAVPLLRRFLATDPAEAQADAARRDIEACGEPVHAPTPEPTPTEANVASPPTETTPAEPVAPPRVTRPTPPRPTRDDGAIALRDDRIALGLVVSGCTVAAGGLATLVAGLVLQRRPTGTDDETDYVDRIQKGRTLATIGAVIGSVGTAMLVAGVVELSVRRRNARRRVAGVSPRTSWAGARRPASAPTR